MSRHMRLILMSTALSFAAGLAGQAMAGPQHPGGGGGGGGHPGGGGGAPHVAAPAAPHFSAPAAPHFSAPAAPHFAAPHMAAPHMAAPHFAAAPHVAPHFAAPHAAPHFAAPPHNAPHFAGHQPHFAAPHGMAHAAAPHGMSRHELAHIEHGHGGAPAAHIASHAPHGVEAHGAHELSRHATASAPIRNEAGHEAGRHGPNAGQTIGTAGHEATGRTQNLGQNLGHNPNQTAGSNRGELNATRGTQAQAHAAPILRNPVFANNAQGQGTSRTGPGQSTFRGSFAQSNWGSDWRHHHHDHFFVVLGFAGPLFWPYAYDDFVDYTFAPYAYDTFWPYAFDDVYTGIFGGYAPEYYAPEDAYAYAGSSASQAVYARTESGAGASVSSSSGNARICSGEAQGVTDFSIQKIAAQVNPDQQQQALLDDLKGATLDAVKVMQAACPTALPSTPTGRIAAMLTRVDAMLKAVQIVRPPLDKFYASLNDEQRERFNALDQSAQAGSLQPAQLSKLCNAQAANGSALPIDRIERDLHLNSDQEADLKSLDDATEKAADILQRKCQAGQTLTPTGRLAAMEDRLSAMSEALRTTQAALNNFYGSLNDEQKARFDRLSVRAS